MGENQVSNQDHEQKVQAVLGAIKDFNGKQVGTEKYDDAYEQIENLIFNSLSTEEAEQIVNAMVEAGIKIKGLLLYIFLSRCQLHSLNKDCVKNIFNIMEDNFVFDNYDSKNFLDACEENSLDADCVKMFLKRRNEYIFFDNYSLPKFLNVCGENSLDGENLENLYRSSYKFSFKDYYKSEIVDKLNSKTSKKLFQKLCEFHELEKGKEQNKKLGIFGIVGITIGGLSGLAAIGLGAAVGVGALAVTIFAPIVAAVVSLVLLGIFGYLTDRFSVDKELIKIKEAKLNGESISKDKIRWDLRKRKKIKDALDKSKESLIQNDESAR